MTGTKRKVGDLVTIRSWHDLRTSFYKDSDGDIVLTRNYFLGAMREFCGKSYEIHSSDNVEGYDSYRLRLPGTSSDSCNSWTFTEETFEQEAFQSTEKDQLTMLFQKETTQKFDKGLL